MNKLKINIITDSNMSRVLGFEENKIPNKVEYVTGNKNYNGITVFIDKCFDVGEDKIIDEINSTVKCAWFHDPRQINDLQQSRLLNLEKNHLNKLDYIMTYDEYLLDTYPNKCIYTADNGIWIQDENIKIHEKTKLMSMIYSFKNWTEGHRLRHLIAQQNIEGLDLFGDGSSHPVKYKEEALVDYQFSITIENSRSKYYYTEKLLDCFAVGTIPIYWGCKNIDEYFDGRGILKFNDLNELAEIFNHINEEPNLYNLMFPYVKNNFEIAKDYIRYEDWIFDNVYKTIIKEKGL